MADQDDINGIDLEVSAEHQMAKENKFKDEWKQEPDRFKVEGYDKDGNKTT